nr:TonB-dependent receptor [Blastocatellia bacterium]
MSNRIFADIGRKSFFATLLAVLLALPVAGQVSTATVNGRVYDAQGNVVPGAKVTVTNRATRLERTAVANSDGLFVVTELPPGRYDLAAEAEGFSRLLREDVELNIGARQTLNFDLQPGNITETVTVTGEQPLIETTRSDIGHTVTPQEIANLPLLNRTFAGLTVVAPEARPVGNFDPTKTRIGNVAFNGGDGRSVNVNVDGGDNKDNVVGSLLQNFSYESIQEFQIQQHRWSADQGRAVGGVVNVVTKSGGNSLRGSFFSNFRDDALTASTFFDRLTRETNPSYEKPAFSRQEYGGSIGGPVIKDRLFYFFALERFRERQSLSVLPSVQSELALIPGTTVDSTIPTPYNDTLLSAKVDHKINNKQSMFYRFSYQGNDSPNDQVASPNPRTNLTGGNFTTNTLYSFLVNHTYNLSPRMLNQFTFHFQDFTNEILAAQEGLTLNFPTGISIGQNANTPQSTLERKYQFRDDFSIVTGNHSIKFGVNYIYTDLGGYFYFGTRGYNVTFNQTPSSIIAGGGFNRTGLLSGLTYSDGASSHDQRIDQLAFYVQDDWKITRKLTLNV